ncbi:MAG: glutaredoxin 3 [Chromatiaceae bacterium]|nr:MAG: glutaredoxin 3 [Chromatiaceae bacterium]
MPSVQIYATGYCPFCTRARALLERKGVPFEEIRIDRDRAQRRIMIERSQRETVPQIFIGDVHIGGYDDMAALDASGALDALLATA